ncbi:MAG TPA: protein kinase [Nannocystaceae bacterium]|nr:protein kinase [Nannocystaceae bacterium]
MSDEHTMHATARPIDEQLAPGTELGRHRVMGKLAEGAHAILYMGEHLQTRAEVAIKVLRAPFVRSGEMLARFDREALVMGRLAGCRTVVQVHDAGALPDGRRYLVMELVRGRELSTVLQNSVRRGVPLELERVLAIAADIASGLRDAHGKSVVHRDLKPSNVMIVREPDGRETAKLVDFGISGDRDQPAGHGDLTMMGAVIGTPEYMGPEQAVGLPAAPKMDLFALGVVLFELVTGTLPPRGALRSGNVPPASSLRTGVPATLDRLIRELLAVDPKQRPDDAIAVLTRLAIAREELRGKSGPNAWAEGRPVRAAGAIELVEGEPVARIRSITEIAPAPMRVRPPRARTGGHRARLAPRLALTSFVCTFAIAAGIGGVMWLRGGNAPRVIEAGLIGLAGTSLAPTVEAPIVEAPIVEAPAIEVPAIEVETPPPAIPPVARAVARKPSPRKPPAVTTDDCAAQRRAAEDASDALRWSAVLEHTRATACWPDRHRRLRLRIEALAELGRFDACVREGEDATDPAIAKIAALCRKRIEGG